MKFNIFKRRNTKKELAEKAQENAAIHAKNIQSIVESKKPADALTRVLRQNHITIQIAGAVGGK